MSKCRVNVKQSLYAPGEALRAPEGWGSQISSRHMKVVRLSALRTGRLYPPKIFLVLISVRGWVNPRAIVWLEGLCHWKFPIKPSGIQPAIFLLVANYRDQIRHRLPQINKYVVIYGMCHGHECWRVLFIDRLEAMPVVVSAVIFILIDILKLATS
jgi:hypothetical protein